MAAFAPDILTSLGPLPITNTLIHTLIVDGILIGTAIFLSKRISTKPKGLQNLIEPVIDGIYGLVESIAPNKKATKAIFPFIATFFLFIFVSNFTGLLPGVGSIGFFPNESSTEHAILEKAYAVESTDHTEPAHSSEKEHLPPGATGDKHKEDKKEEHHATITPLLRAATSDINVTLALATLSVIFTHMLSIHLTGFTDYITRYFSFNPVNLYIGLLELVAEVMKILSLSFRLFGNIYAGEVALHTISGLFAFLAPLPFLILESIVSVVQALVFSVLTLVFMSILATPHHAHEEVNH